MEKLREKWKVPHVNRVLVESSQKALSYLQPITFEQLYENQIAQIQQMTYPQPEDYAESARSHESENEYENEYEKGDAVISSGDEQQLNIAVLPLTSAGFPVEEASPLQDRPLSQFTV